MEGLPLADRLCEAIGDRVRGGRVVPETDVAGDDLDVLPGPVVFDITAPRRHAIAVAGHGACRSAPATVPGSVSSSKKCAARWGLEMFDEPVLLRGVGLNGLGNGSGTAPGAITVDRGRAVSVPKCGERCCSGPFLDATVAPGAACFISRKPATRTPSCAALEMHPQVRSEFPAVYVLSIRACNHRNGCV